MSIEIRREDHQSLTEYAAIATAFEVREAIGALTAGRPPNPLPRRVVSRAFRKDYDAIAGNGPDGWPARFAVDRARFFAAYDNGRRVGGTLEIVEPSDVAQLETQDINVEACHLYAHAGYIIRSIDPAAYPDIAGETQIIWAKSFEFPT